MKKKITGFVEGPKYDPTRTRLRPFFAYPCPIRIDIRAIRINQKHDLNKPNSYEKIQV